MDDLIEQIEKGLQNNLFYLSLFVSLAIPDICGALGSRNGKATGKKYSVWFDNNVGKPKNYNIKGLDCYMFRCSLLHQGSTIHNDSTFKRILFVEPNASSNTFHNNIIQGALNIDVRIFCIDIVNAARAWVQTKSNDSIFIKNYTNMIKRYPNGLPPYFKGISVIS